MSITASIETIVTTLYPDATFVLSSKFQANVISHGLDPDELPLVVLDNELPKNNEIKLNNNIQKDSQIILWILLQDSEDNTDAQSQVLVDTAEAMADRIAVNVYQLPEIRPIGNQKYKTTPVFHVFNTNSTGVLMEMKANENVVVNFCSQP